MLVVAAFCGTSSGSGVAKIGGTVRGNGGRGAMLAVNPTGSNITNVLSYVSFTVPARSSSG